MREKRKSFGRAFGISGAFARHHVELFYGCLFGVDGGKIWKKKLVSCKDLMFGFVVVVGREYPVEERHIALPPG